jgi:hypothetical protein
MFLKYGELCQFEGFLGCRICLIQDRHMSKLCLVLLYWPVLQREGDGNEKDG